MITIDEFFYYLVDYIDGYGYEDMLKVLYKTPFEAKVKTDSNLLVSAREFREERTRITDYPGNCFEVLVQMAIDMDDILYDSKHGTRVDQWFWIFMDNMGLTNYDNNDFDYDAVARIVDSFNRRKYKVSGEGGPCPLNRPTKNLRKTDYWYQINMYVNENFAYEYDNLEEDEDE